MTTRIAGYSVATTLALGGLAVGANAAPVEIDVTNAQNGVTDIYSATFDPGLVPCGAGSPSYCDFFGGDPPASRALVITPNPTTVVQGVPDGIGPNGKPNTAPIPPPGSFLDLTLGNYDAQGKPTSLTIAGGTIKTPVLIVTINSETVVTATAAGFTFNLTPQTASVDANGRAEFLVNLVAPSLVDFSHFPIVVKECTGSLCDLIKILNLDMVRYRLAIDYDASFGSFTGQYIGQTANSSLVFATLNSGTPEIAVTDSAAPANDLEVPFGQVTQADSLTRQITVTNVGGGNLILGNVGATDAVAAPFSISNDACSGQTLRTLATPSCTFDVTFAPAITGPFPPDTLDIPSNDADEGSVTVTVSGSGAAAPVPVIFVTDSTGQDSDREVAFGTQSTGSQVTETITVANQGNASLAVGQISAPADPQFTVVNDSCSGRTVAPAAACTVGLRYQPTAPGSFPDSVDIPSNDPDEPSVTVTITAAGAGPAIPNIRLTDPTAPGDDRSLSFDNVRVNGSFDRTIKIINAGGAELIVGNIGGVESLDVPFSIVSGEDFCSGQILAPADTCTVGLRFEPTEIAFRSDTFDVPSNDPDEPSVTVSVSGDGVEDPGSTTLTPDGASSGFMAMDPATLAMLAGAVGWGWRRRRAQQRA